jgi:hypothetical protein
LLSPKKIKLFVVNIFEKWYYNSVEKIVIQGVNKMNSKTIVKRTLPLIIALVIVIIVAVSCTIFAGDKENPTIDNQDADFLKIGDISVSNQSVYKDLKFKYGAQTLIDMIDKDLLDKTMNSNGVSYYDAVTEVQINDAIEKAMFPNGRTGDTEADAKQVAQWERENYLAGLRTSDAYKAAFRLTLAKKQYTRDKLEAQEDVVTDAAISSYYSSNYRKSYWVLVIQYNTLKEANNALSQIDVTSYDVKYTENGVEKTVKKWIKAGTKEAQEPLVLTEEEIKQAHIDLYNNANAKNAPGYPNTGTPSKNIVLGADQYTVVDSKINFNTSLVEVAEGAEDSPKNLFYYTSAELDALSSSLTSAVSSLSTYMSEGAKLEKTYFTTPKAAGSKYFFAFKIQFEESIELYKDGKVINTELENEIKQILIDGLVTDTEIATKMAALRKGTDKDSQLVIYDSSLESSYISGYDAEHKETKKEEAKIIARVGDTTYKAQQLFEELNNLYGVSSSYVLYLREMLLQSDYNKIYNVKTEKVIDEEEWNGIKEEIQYLKTSFANGSFGVDPSYGWEKFLKDYNNVESEKALLIDLLYDRVFKEYSKEIAQTTEDLFNTVYLPNMKKIQDKYLSATGIHLLIYKLDKKGAIVDPNDTKNPEKWTAYEIAAAEELYVSVLEKLEKVHPDNYQTILQTEIISEYDNAPRFVANLEQQVEGQPVYNPLMDWIKLEAKDYLYSKAKTAGLVIKFESLTISGGQMVEPFENAVRKIWDEAEKNNEFGETVVVYDQEFEDYLVTEFGYHVYVNLTTTNRPNVKTGEVTDIAQLPAYKDILVYEDRPVEGEKDRELTNLESKQITTFYSPINKEIAGDAYKQLKISNMLLEKMTNVTFANASLKDVLMTTLNYNVEKSYESLTYIKSPTVEE